mgnify:FL=1
MRYFSITLITFVVLIVINSIVSNVNLANDALDIEFRLSEENQLLTAVNLDLSSDTPQVDWKAKALQSPLRIPEHPWVEEWPKAEAEDQINSDIVRHLLLFNDSFSDTPFDLTGQQQKRWLARHLELRTRLQILRIELARYLVERAREVFLVGSLSSIALFAALLTLVFYFVFRAQRQSLKKSQMQNITLEAQRQTLLASQRAMVSISDDEQRAILRAEQLASLVEQSSEGFIRINELGQVLHCNEAATKLFSGVKQLAPLDSFVNLFEPKRRPELQQAIERTLKDDSVLTIAPADNEIDSAIELTITRVVDSGPLNSVGVSILARDVSQLMREQKQLTQIIETAPNALFVCDEQAIITVANNQTEQLFGYEPGELIGQLVDILVSPRQRAAHVAKRHDFLRQPEEAHIGHDRELMALRKDGSEFPVEIGLNPMNIGKQLLVVASVFDLTEQRRQKSELEATNQLLETRNEEMEQFIYTVSHDLKSPLFTISGFAHQLKESIENISAEQANKVERIQSNVDRMGRLLDDLLQLSRVIRIDLELATVDTDILIDNVLLTLEGTVREAGAEIIICRPLAAIDANEGMLFQCAQNLITNALKYVDDNVSPRLVISSTVDKSSVQLHFEDNGTGIDPKHHERIFQIFQRLDTREGTGVGLSIIKTIMDRHGGSVALESETGKGSTFSLIFPQTS